MLIDYHLHNHFSPDSEADTADLLKAEQAHGVRHMCITNHAETFDRKEEVAGFFDPEEADPRFGEIQKELEGVRPRFPDMDIRFGVELQYQAEHMDALAKFVKRTPFDFILGSVHIIDGVLISGGKHAGEAFRPMKEQVAYTHYFEDVLKLVEWGHFDHVAHFDICKKFGHLHYGPFRPEKYKTEIQRVLVAMKTKGIGIELNAGSLHKNCHELFPHPDILKWCIEIGIENYSFGSDAHELLRAGTYLPEVLAIAKEVGIAHISTYKGRVATRHKI
jgi:histidinol-phosphatase (PHP family)